MQYTNGLHRASIRYPNHPGSRTGSPETSEEAANAIAPLARNHRNQILAFLKAVYPEARSSDQIADAIGLSHYAVRPRTSELFADQKIERTNDRTKNENGRSVVLWRAVA
jgi:predicted ArsR family transcriptional regulator